MISVVIPMYNSKDTIKGCIDSVLNQSKVELIDEVLVINDGSTDGCDDLVRITYSNQPIVKVIDKTNGGVSSARNLGMKTVKAEWVALLDSDDQWYHEKIEKQVEVLNNNRNIYAIGTGCLQDNTVTGHKFNDGVYYMTVKDLLKKYWPHTSSYLINRKVFNRVGFFSETRSYGEDGQYFLKIAEQYPIYYLTEPLITCGDGKPTFGYSGLSANLKEMHNGCRNNVIECYKRKDINVFECAAYCLWEEIKYFRRILIVKKRQQKE